MTDPMDTSMPDELPDFGILMPLFESEPCQNPYSNYSHQQMDSTVPDVSDSCVIYKE